MSRKRSNYHLPIEIGAIPACDNYTDIALFDITCEVLTTLVKKRPEIFTEILLGKYEDGFWEE